MANALVSLCRFFCLSLFIAATPLLASSYPTLEEPFNASNFTSAEIELIQRALTFSGHYSGLWDGQWGPLSRSAIETYSRENYGDELLINYGIIPLILEGINKVDEIGWIEKYFPEFNVTVGVPHHIVGDEFRDTGIAFVGGGVSIEVFVENPSQLSTVHINLARAAIEPPYLVRDERRWVTAVRTVEGTNYFRSDWTGRNWVSLWIDAAEGMEEYVRYVSASYRFGSLEELPDSAVANITELLVRALEEFENEEQGGQRESGTGFFITPNRIVTNQHVIAQCSQISIPEGTGVRLLAASEEYDLAVLAYEGRADEYLSIADVDDVRLGMEVSAVGFPLYGVINTGLNFTTGVVSAVNGFADNVANFTLTAPLQPGNSGGPVIDRAGSVIGVAVATASVRLAEIGGFIPQNINWAIKGSTLKRFLEENGVKYETLPQKAHAFGTGLSEAVAATVTPIICN